MPLMLREFLRVIEHDQATVTIETTAEETGRIWMYICCLIGLQAIVVTLQTRSDVMMTKVGLEIRAILSVAVYDNTCWEMATHAASAKDLNLLAQDAQRLMEFMQFAQRFLTAPLGNNFLCKNFFCALLYAYPGSPRHYPSSHMKIEIVWKIRISLITQHDINRCIGI